MSVEHRYWDACTFLAWLKGESGRENACRSVISEAQAGRCVIVTSTLTLAEILNLKGAQPIPSADRETVRAFFRHAWIAFVQLDRSIAEQAQEVVWEHGVKPKDAVHVATAVRAGVTQLDTFDEGLQSRSGKVGEPPLRVGPPRIEGILFGSELAPEE